MLVTELELDRSADDRIADPVVFTIGTFDGVHVGHQALLKRGKEEALRLGAKFAILTFRTPPSWLLFPEKKKPLLTSFDERIRKLEAINPDHIFLLDFTKEVAALSVEEFFSKLQKHFRIVKFIFGHDATIGSDQENNRDNILRGAKKEGFEVEFVPPVLFNGHPVSSSLIRRYIEEGRVKEAQELMNNAFTA